MHHNPDHLRIDWSLLLGVFIFGAALVVTVHVAPKVAAEYCEVTQ